MISETSTYAETERLILRSWKPDDLPLFVEMIKDHRVMNYFPALLTEEETAAFYNRIQDEFIITGRGLYAVELKSTGHFIGYVGLHEIGFEADFTPGIELGGVWLLIITIRDMLLKQRKRFCGWQRLRGWYDYSLSLRR